MGWSKLRKYVLLGALLLCPSPAAAQVSDNFNRSDGSLGANWTDSFSGWQINSNAIAPTSGTENISVYTAFTPANDQYTEIRLNAFGNGGPAVRVSSSALTGYFALFNSATVDLYKAVAGSYTLLSTVSSGPVSTAGLGLIARIQVVGTSIDVLYDGTSLTTATDATLASGFGAAYNYGTGGGYDDVTIGSIGGGGGGGSAPQGALLGVGK